jgi:hypothetical protein
MKGGEINRVEQYGGMRKYGQQSEYNLNTYKELQMENDKNPPTDIKFNMDKELKRTIQQSEFSIYTEILKIGANELVDLMNKEREETFLKQVEIRKITKTYHNPFVKSDMVFYLSQCQMPIRRATEETKENRKSKCCP